ncbi:hypothetical protein [Modestobacter sp. SYSU DS0657]
MGSPRTWLAGLPRRRRRWLVAGLSIAAYAAGYVVVVALIAQVRESPADWTGPLPAFLGAAVGASFGAWLQARRLGGVDRAEDFRGALRSGRLPDGADPLHWRRSLLRERRVLRGQLAAGLVLVACLVIAVLALLPGRNDWPGSALPLGALAVLLVVIGWGAVRGTRRIDRLLQQLPDGSSARPPG